MLAHAWLLAARAPALAPMLQQAPRQRAPDAREDSQHTQHRGGWRHTRRRCALPPLPDTGERIDRPTLHLLLHYVYTGHIDAPLHALPTLRAAAALLGLDDLVEAMDAELVLANLWKGLDGHVTHPSACPDQGAGLPTRCACVDRCHACRCHA